MATEREELLRQASTKNFTPEEQELAAATQLPPGFASTLASTGRTPEPFQQYALSGIIAALPNEDYPSATISTPQGERKVQVGQLLDERYGHEITEIFQERDDRGILQWKMEVTPPEGAGRPFLIHFPGKGGTPTPENSLYGPEGSMYGPEGPYPTKKPLEPIGPLSLETIPLATAASRMSEDQALGLDPHKIMEFSKYQSDHIYKGDLIAQDSAKADLNLRINNPEQFGTIESSEQPDYQGSGWTMHTVKGEDMSRYFLQNPVTGTVLNVTTEHGPLKLLD